MLRVDTTQPCIQEASLLCQEQLFSDDAHLYEKIRAEGGEVVPLTNNNQGKPLIEEPKVEEPKDLCEEFLIEESEEPTRASGALRMIVAELFYVHIKQTLFLVTSIKYYRFFVPSLSFYFL